jgi:hypothetical protein
VTQPLTDEQLKAVIALLTAQRNLSEIQTKDFYYHIHINHWETVVSGQDAKDANAAFEFATKDKLHPWYFTDDFIDVKTITLLNHNEWVDWVRS